MNLEQKLDEIVSIRYWDFSGLPKLIIEELDILISKFDREELVKILLLLVETYAEREFKSRGATSGIGGEYNMMLGMRLKYAQESLEYLAKC